MAPTPLSRSARSADDVIAELAALRTDDVKWSEGRAFGMVYDGGPAVHEVAERAAAMYLHENALNTKAFPSLARLQSDVVSWTASLMHGPDSAAGFMTSGGTESIQVAVLAARERARVERGVTEPEMVISDTTHAAFHKSAHMYGMTVHKVACRSDYTADVAAMARYVNENTVLVVGSAPQYPQGVVDPIPEIAELAATVDANCHVDACMGGFVLPFAEMLGRNVEPWDFRVEGVHSISADVHKLGYAPKGASVIVYRNRELRAHQTFVFSDWLGGFYASPNLQGTRSGLPMAAAWAVMSTLGIEGYMELTRRTLGTADAIRAAVRSIDGLTVLGDPRFHLLTIASDTASTTPIDAFALGDALLTRGWFHDRQSPPDTLHATVSNSNVDHLEHYLADLHTCADEVRGTHAADRSTNYATLE
ncbi:MAG: pyridoxal phosphate-dependent decarboxylase family protein [Ilumatobacteraceae bacterium]